MTTITTIRDGLVRSLRPLGWEIAAEQASAISDSRYVTFGGPLPALSARGRAVWLRRTRAAAPLTAGQSGLLIRISDHVNSGSPRRTPQFSIFGTDQIRRITEAIELWTALAVYYPEAQPPRENIPVELRYDPS